MSSALPTGRQREAALHERLEDIQPALDELYGLGYANLDAEDAHFEAVTVADTRDVAAKYLRAEEAVVAVVRPQCVAEEVGTIADGVSDSTYCTAAEWRLILLRDGAQFSRERSTGKLIWKRNRERLCEL